jgi:hypothetical protein
MVASCLLMAAASFGFAQQPAGTTADRATRVTDTIMLSLQSGSNYIRIDTDHLPATITYMPDTAFGPIPVAMVMDDTLPVQRLFAECSMVWRWEFEKADKARIVEIKAHERARLLAEPFVCHPSFSDTAAAVCGGLEWRGEWYDESGDYNDTLVNAEGCDSIRTLHLVVYPQPENTDTTAVVWDSISWYGTMYYESGDYVLDWEDGNGCEYTHTLHLTVHHTLYNASVEEVCDSFVFGDTTYLESTEFIVDTTLLESGDRTVNSIILIVNYSSSVELEAEKFDAFTAPWGTTYTESGVYRDTTVNAAGCDSVATLRLTIHTTYYDTISELGCDRIVIEGKTYTRSGEYTDTIATGEGDRVIKTIYVSIRYSSYVELTAEEFDSYIAPWGTTYTESGEYRDTLQNIAGCDSITTLLLTIHTTSYDTIRQEGCDRIVIAGKTYTESGEYVDTLINEAGDRSIRTLYLTIGYSSHRELTVVDYNNYLAPWGETYTQSGDYTYTTVNVSGCDSVVTLHLTIKRMEYDTVYFCRGFNTTHDEQVHELLIRRFRPYNFVSPAEVWNQLMEGVEIAGEPSRTLMDLNRAENNMRAYYTGDMTPVESVMWSESHDGGVSYTPLTVAAEPQWIDAGTLAVQIQFRCGEIYNTEFPMAIDQVGAAQTTTKRIENGQVIIRRGGVDYNLMGVKIEHF